MRHAVNVSTASTIGSPTVERLVRAAADAFAAKGFHATTTRDIASRAGLSPAGVYVHFPSKEDLLFHLSRSGHELAHRIVQDAVAASPRPPEQLAAVMSRFAQWHAEHYQLARVVQYEFPHLTVEHRGTVLALRKRIDSTVRAVLRDGIETRDFSVDNVPDTTLALLSLVVDVARWYSPASSRSPADIGRTYAALGLRLVGASS